MKQIALILFCAAIPAAAATVSGRVLDPSKAVAPGARVRLIRAADAKTLEATSGPDGRYEISGATAGSYLLEVASPGFQYFRRSVTIRSDNEQLTADANLSLGEIQESMRVEARGTPKAAAAPMQIRVGGAVQAAKLMHRVSPEYPESARKDGREGVVLFRATIAKDGAVTDLMPMSGGDAELTAAAARAVKQWKYQPTLLNGAPVVVVSTIEVAFKLTD